MLNSLQQQIRQSIDSTPQKAARFFKTGRGDYAEHEQFLGITMPTLRRLAQQHKDLTLKEVSTLLQSPFNEERLLALLILVEQYTTYHDRQEEIYHFYRAHIPHMNNWNLVDVSAHLIVGAYLWDKERNPLWTMARSSNLWERRIAIVATWYFIKRKDIQDTLTLAQVLLEDTHDLIHKAVGWMLREVGKQKESALLAFLDVYGLQMPRTTLRYAIERLPNALRQHYLLKAPIST